MTNPTSFTLGPTPEGARPIRLSRGAVAKARKAAAGWTGPGPAFVCFGDALTECYGHGLIGVSTAMIKVIATCLQEAPRTTPVLFFGEPGTELVAAAESVHALGNDAHEMETLDCAALTEQDVHREPDQALAWHGHPVLSAGPSSRLDRLLGPFGGPEDPPDILLTHIGHTPLVAQARILSAIDNPGSSRVLATTNTTIAALERPVEEGGLLPELLQRLCAGRAIELPPLCKRPEDLPMLIYYYVQRYRRGDCGPQEEKVKSISAEWLYFAAGRRWARNLGELERSVTDACRAASRIDGTMCLRQPGEEPSGRADWPTECPFVVSWPAYITSIQHDLARYNNVSIEDLSGYDLRALLEAVDSHADSAKRGRWTLEARYGQYEPKRDEGSGEEVQAQPSVKEDPDLDGGNLWIRTSAGWSVRYGGVTVSIATTTKGMRAIGHLLSVREPPGGAREVAAVMDAKAFDPNEMDESQRGIPALSKKEQMTPEQQVLYRLAATGHQFGSGGPQLKLTLNQVRQVKSQMGKKLEDIDNELDDDEASPERREDLLGQRAIVERYLSSELDIRGKSRLRGSNVAHKVGNAIDRSLAAIDRQVGVADDPQEKNALAELHHHLGDCIGSKHTDNIRYTGECWIVDM
jgi:hypothetical protein